MPAKKQVASDSTIAKKLAEKFGLKNKQSKEFIQEYQNEVLHHAKTDGRVRTGFGVFKTKHIPAQKGGQKKKNPFTGEEYKTKAKPANVKLKLTVKKTAKQAVGGHMRG